MKTKNVAILDDNNIVLNIIIVNDDFICENNQIIYTEENPAYIGGDYVNGVFYTPKPYSSWVRNEIKGVWEAPYPDLKTSSNNESFWDEGKKEWVVVGYWDDDETTYITKGWNSSNQEWEDSIIQRYNEETKEYTTEVVKDLPLTKE